MERTINYQHAVNEYVSYRHSGIFKISEICDRELVGNGKKSYYVLQSVYDKNSKIYVPTDVKDLSDSMKHILTVDEINSIIARTEEISTEWIDDNSERANRFSEILNRGDRAEILWLVKMLSLHKGELSEQKKKFYSCDEKILNIAEKMITEEFAFVLGIKKDDVIPYIITQCENQM